MSKDLNFPNHLLDEMRKEISVCESDGANLKTSSTCVCPIAALFKRPFNFCY